jgi:hypothetical protein
VPLLCGGEVHSEVLENVIAEAKQCCGPILLYRVTDWMSSPDVGTASGWRVMSSGILRAVCANLKQWHVFLLVDDQGRATPPWSSARDWMGVPDSPVLVDRTLPTLLTVPWTDPRATRGFRHSTLPHGTGSDLQTTYHCFGVVLNPQAVALSSNKALLLH